MELIKENKEKNRSVYKLENGNIKKYWHSKKIDWVISHVKILDKLVPDYVLRYGEDKNGAWAELNYLNGTPANAKDHTDEFINFIYSGCLKNLKDTAPYAHGDWVLSNMFIDGDRLNFCDWDNVGIYDQQMVIVKLHLDLYSAFGNKFCEITGYDPTGI